MTNDNYNVYIIIVCAYIDTFYNNQCLSSLPPPTQPPTIS